MAVSEGRVLVPPARIELAAHGLGIHFWCFHALYHAFIFNTYFFDF